jgi:hypothetical protein
VEVYPNPVVEQASIRFLTQLAGRTQLQLYNSVGSLVATLYDEVTEAGQQQRVELARENLPNGLYFCRLSTEGKVLNQRFVVER